MEIKTITMPKKERSNFLTLRAQIISTIYELGNPIQTEIMKKLDVTYAYLAKIMNELEKEGIVKRKREGRRIVCSLTWKGEELGKLFSEALKVENKYFNK